MSKEKKDNDKNSLIDHEAIETISTLLDCLDNTYNTIKANKLIDLQKDDRRSKLSDYKIIALLSKGAFGEVYLVSKDNQPFALKRILKETVSRQPSTALHMEERDLMIKARESKYLVFVHCTFQDESAIYFVMDFFPGGDFINLLAKEPMKEEDVKFYAAEILLALKELHSYNFIHRDLKPENLLITKEGHLKLCDFGSCIAMKDGKVRCDVTVGTPDYISPEVLCSINSISEYGTEVDLWTFGALLYEMINDDPPFYSDLLEETYERISKINYEHKNGSNEIKDLISNLLVHKEKRFTIEQIMNHSFFKGVDFNNIHKSKPPKIPNISSSYDISYFPDANTSFNFVKNDKIDYKGFIGFSFDPNFCEYFLRKYLGSLKSTSDLASYVCNPEKNEIKNETIIENKPKYIDGFNSTNDKSICSSSENTHILANEKITNISEEVLADKFMQLNLSKGLKKEIDSLSLKNKCIIENECNLHNRKSELCFEFSCKKEIVCLIHNKDMSLCLGRKTLTEANLPNKIKKLSLNNSLILQIKNSFRELNFLIEKMYLSKAETNLRKEIKIKKIQIKEYQQKLEEQIQRNTFMEEEIFFLKNEIKRLSKKRKESLKLEIKSVFAHRCKNKVENRLNNYEEVDLLIENELLYFKNEVYNLNNVVVSSLKKHELSQMSNKQRNLILSFNFIEIKRREKEKSNLKAVEENLKKELKIKEGLERMLNVMKGNSLKQTEEQLIGTIKRIEYLRNSLEIGRKLTDCSFEDYKESVNKYEFNNHSFKQTSFPENTLCDHCNDFLRGISLQGLKCDDCSFVVHKKCFVLVKDSCEMREAIMNGDKWYILFNCLEDKEKVAKIFKFQ